MGSTRDVAIDGLTVSSGERYGFGVEVSVKLVCALDEAVQANRRLPSDRLVRQAEALGLARASLSGAQVQFSERG